MQNLARRQWGANLTLKEGIEQAIDWLNRARQKNIISKKKSTIYHAYLIKQIPNTENYRPISGYFRYSAKDTPQTDRARDELLRLMSVSMKAHFFLADKEKILHEPYVSAIPNLNGPYDLFLLIYPLSNDQAIISSEIDFKKLEINNEIITDFSVALTGDSFKWFWLKDWYSLKNNADNLKLKEQKEQEIIEKPVSPENKKPNINIKQETNKEKTAKNKKFFNPNTLQELQEIGTVVDVPWEFKDKLKPLGIEWAPQLKTWYLPHGYDLDSVLEFLEELKKKKPN